MAGEPGERVGRVELPGDVRDPGRDERELAAPPDGGNRVITFRDGKVSSTDADSPFKVERRDDWSIVRIGKVEVYEIPDALVFGG